MKKFKTTKRVCAWVLVICMICSLFTTTAAALDGSDLIGLPSASEEMTSPEAEPTPDVSEVPEEKMSPEEEEPSETEPTPEAEIPPEAELTPEAEITLEAELTPAPEITPEAMLTPEAAVTPEAILTPEITEAAEEEEAPEEDERVFGVGREMILMLASVPMTENCTIEVDGSDDFGATNTFEYKITYTATEAGAEVQKSYTGKYSIYDETGAFVASGTTVDGKITLKKETYDELKSGWKIAFETTAGVVYTVCQTRAGSFNWVENDTITLSPTADDHPSAVFDNRMKHDPVKLTKKWADGKQEKTDELKDAFLEDNFILQCKSAADAEWTDVSESTSSFSESASAHLTTWEVTHDDLPATDKDGNALEYRVTERLKEGGAANSLIEDYISTTSADGQTVTNQLKVNLDDANKDFCGEIVWEDKDNETGGHPTRPTEADYASHLTLFCNGTEVSFPTGDSLADHLEITEDTANTNRWQLQLKNLPKYDSEGNELTYSLVQSEIKNADDAADKYKYLVEYTNIGQYGGEATALFNGGTIENIRRESTVFTFQVEWIDGNRQPIEDATYMLYRYAEKDGGTFETSSPVQNFDSIVCVDGVFMCDGVELPYTTTTTADGKEIHTYTYIGKGSTAADPVTNLDKYSAAGAEYTYFIKQVDLGSPDYQSTYYDKNGNTPTFYNGVGEENKEENVIPNGGKVVNRLSSIVDPSITKTWVAKSLSAVMSDLKVSLQLQRRYVKSYNADGTTNDWTEWETVMDDSAEPVVPVTAVGEGFSSAEPTKSVGFTGYPLYTQDEEEVDGVTIPAGTKIEYRCEEIGIIYKDGELLKFDEGESDLEKDTLMLSGIGSDNTDVVVQQVYNESHTELTNQLIEKTQVEVQKTWSGAAGWPAGAVSIVTLKREDGKPAVDNDGNLIADIVLSAGNLTDTFANLPRFDDGGREITYYVEEKNPVNYVDNKKFTYNDTNYSRQNKQDVTDPELSIRTTIAKMSNTQPGVGEIRINVNKRWLDDGDMTTRQRTLMGVFAKSDVESGNAFNTDGTLKQGLALATAELSDGTAWTGKLQFQPGSMLYWQVTAADAEAHQTETETAYPVYDSAGNRVAGKYWNLTDADKGTTQTNYPVYSKQSRDFEPGAGTAANVTVVTGATTSTAALYWKDAAHTQTTTDAAQANLVDGVAEPVLIYASGTAAAEDLHAYYFQERTADGAGSADDYIALEISVGGHSVAYTQKDGGYAWIKDAGTRVNDSAFEPANATQLNGKSIGEAESDKHLYHVYIGYTGATGMAGYVIYNQRYGVQEINVSKVWKNGSIPKEAQPKAAYYTITQYCGGVPTGVDVLAGGFAAYSSELTGYNASAGGNQYSTTESSNCIKTISINGTDTKVIELKNSQSDASLSKQAFYIRDLPKYDSLGRLLSYQLKEVAVLDPDGTSVRAMEGGSVSVSIYKEGTGAGSGSYTYSKDGTGATKQYDTYGSDIGDPVVTNGGQNTNDVLSYQTTNTRSQTFNVQLRKIWRDDGTGNVQSDVVVLRPDIYFRLYRFAVKPGVAISAEGDLINKDDLDLADLISKSEKISGDFRWDTKKNDWYWTNDTSGSFARYDAEGNEYIYYAVEYFNGDSKGYAAQYYNGTALPTETVAADATTKDVFAAETDKSKVLVVHKEGDGLQANGSVVNVKCDTYKYSSSKTWRNLPAGFSESKVPTVVMELYRTLEVGLTDAQKDRDYVLANWEKVSTKEGTKSFDFGTYDRYDSYGRKYKYNVEERYYVKDDSGTYKKYVKDGEVTYLATTATAPAGYVSDGTLYTALDKIPGYTSQEKTNANSFSWINTYDPGADTEQFVEIDINKTWVLPKYESNELPTQVFELWRRIDGITGSDELASTDTKAKTTVAFTNVDGTETKTATTSVTFEYAADNKDTSAKLPYYAPNGTPYTYYVKEVVPPGYMGSVTGAAATVTQQGNGKHDESLLISTDLELARDAAKSTPTQDVYTNPTDDVHTAYTNTYNGVPSVTCTAEKTWAGDQDNLYSTRPTDLALVLNQNQNATTVEVASTQGTLSGIAAPQGTWSGKDAGNVWTFKFDNRVVLANDTAHMLDPAVYDSSEDLKYNFPKYAPNGDLYEYSFAETAPLDYTAGTWSVTTTPGSVKGTITNTLQTTNITAKKIWQGTSASHTPNTWALSNDELKQLIALNVVPASIKFTLEYSDDGGTSWSTLQTKSGTSVPVDVFVDVETGTLDQVKAIRDTGVKFENLPKYVKGTNTLRQYRVKESYTEVSGQFQMNNDGAGTVATADSSTTSATNIIELKQVTMKKIWHDENNQDKLRPATIDFKLTQNGKDATYTLKPPTGGGDVWTAEAWAPAATTTVTEKTVPTGYVASTSVSDDTYTITNTHDVKVTSITAGKAWADSNNVMASRPENVKFALQYYGGTAAGWQVVSYAKPVSAAELPGAKVDGNTYIYFTKETGSTSTRSNGYYMWCDTGAFATSPSYQPTDTICSTSTIVQTLTPDASGVWPTAEWSNIPENNKGTKVKYRVVEVQTDTLGAIQSVSPAIGYQASYAVANASATSYTSTDTTGFTVTEGNTAAVTVTNTLKTADLAFTKEWADQQNAYTKSMRPQSVTYKLEYRKSNETDWKPLENTVAKIGTADLTDGVFKVTCGDAATSVKDTVTISGLPIKDNADNQYLYRISEVSLLNTGSTTAVDAVLAKTSGAITWSTPTAANGYTSDFTDSTGLADPESNTIGAYTITKGKTYWDATNTKWVSEIKNTLETVNLKATKNWSDDGNRDNLEATVRLSVYSHADKALATSTSTPAPEPTEAYDASIRKSITATESWTATWENLPKYYKDATGHTDSDKIAYTIVELNATADSPDTPAVPALKDNIVSYTQADFTQAPTDSLYESTVTNTHDIYVFNVSPQKVWSQIDSGTQVFTESDSMKNIRGALTKTAEITLELQYDAGTDGWKPVVETTLCKQDTFPTSQVTTAAGGAASVIYFDRQNKTDGSANDTHASGYYKWDGTAAAYVADADGVYTTTTARLKLTGTDETWTTTEKWADLPIYKTAGTAITYRMIEVRDDAITSTGWFAKSVEFTGLNTEGTIKSGDQTETITNRLSSLTLNKYGKIAGSVPLKDVQFTMQQLDASGDPTGTAVTVTTDNSGKATFYNIPDGTYRITELNTAAGHQLLAQPFTVTFPLSLTQAELEQWGTRINTENAVQSDDKSSWTFYRQTYSVTNTATFDMPASGSSGIWVPGIIGMAMVLFILLYLFKRRHLSAKAEQSNK